MKATGKVRFQLASLYQAKGSTVVETRLLSFVATEAQGHVESESVCFVGSKRALVDG